MAGACALSCLMTKVRPGATRRQGSETMRDTRGHGAQSPPPCHIFTPGDTGLVAVAHHLTYVTRHDGGDKMQTFMSPGDTGLVAIASVSPRLVLLKASMSLNI